jgi:hypothetical protein
MEMKKCRKCGQVKATTEFREKRNTCKTCTREYSRNNRIQIMGERYNRNTCKPEMKEVVEKMIAIRNLQKDLRENRKKVLKGKGPTS